MTSIQAQKVTLLNTNPSTEHFQHAMKAMPAKHHPTFPYKPIKPPATSAPKQTGPSTSLPSPLFVPPPTPNTASASQQPTYETSAQKARRQKAEKEEAEKGWKETFVQRVKRERERQARRREERGKEEGGRYLNPGGGKEEKEGQEGGLIGGRLGKRKGSGDSEGEGDEPPVKKTKTQDEDPNNPKTKRPTRKQPGRSTKVKPGKKNTDSDSDAAPSSPGSFKHSVYDSDCEKSDEEHLSESEQSGDETKLTGEDDDSEVEEVLRPRSPVRSGRINPPRGAKGNKAVVKDTQKEEKEEEEEAEPLASRLPKQKKKEGKRQCHGKVKTCGIAPRMDSDWCHVHNPEKAKG